MHKLRILSVIRNKIFKVDLKCCVVHFVDFNAVLNGNRLDSLFVVQPNVK